jgi:hypothetical protein
MGKAVGLASMGCLIILPSAALYLLHFRSLGLFGQIATNDFNI